MNLVYLKEKSAIEKLLPSLISIKLIIKSYLKGIGDSVIMSSEMITANSRRREIDKSDMIDGLENEVSLILFHCDFMGFI